MLYCTSSPRSSRHSLFEHGGGPGDGLRSSAKQARIQQTWAVFPIGSQVIVIYCPAQRLFKPYNFISYSVQKSLSMSLFFKKRTSVFSFVLLCEAFPRIDPNHFQLSCLWLLSSAISPAQFLGTRHIAFLFHRNYPAQWSPINRFLSFLGLYHGNSKF